MTPWPCTTRTDGDARQLARWSPPIARPVLELKPNCERCGRALPPDSVDATICSYECTFCDDCTAGPLAGICPTCGGELLRRPRRMPPRSAAPDPAS